jgi:uncharacterized protein
MNMIQKLVFIFWTSEEKRFRAIWRILLQAVMAIIIGAALLFFLLFVTGMIYLLVTSQMQAFISGKLTRFVPQEAWVYSIIYPLSTFAGLFISALLSARWFDRRRNPLKDFGLGITKQWLLDFSFGLGLGALLMALVFALGVLTGAFEVKGFFKSFWLNTPFIAAFPQIAVNYFFVGVYEEVAFRGYILVNLAEGLNLRFIGRRAALIFAWVLTSLVFGVLHATNPNATLISTFNIFLAGLFLGLGMVLTGDLAISIGLHITWNFFQGNVFGFAVSGIKNGATLINTEALGPVWFTGGRFGPEAGLIGLLAMVIGSSLILLWVRRRGKLAFQEDLSTFSPVPSVAADQLLDEMGQHASKNAP